MNSLSPTSHFLWSVTEWQKKLKEKKQQKIGPASSRIIFGPRAQPRPGTIYEPTGSSIIYTTLGRLTAWESNLDRLKLCESMHQAPEN